MSECMTCHKDVTYRVHGECVACIQKSKTTGGGIVVENDALIMHDAMALSIWDFVCTMCDEHDYDTDLGDYWDGIASWIFFNTDWSD